MSNFINTVDVLGDEVVVNSIINKIITEFKDNVVTVVGTLSFGNCSQLKIVDLPNVTAIKARGFQQCSALTAFILRNTNTVCTLENTNGFYNSAVSKATCKIYVPRALVDTYKSATNWSGYASQFRALEDYTVDGTITGAFDESKI